MSDKHIESVTQKNKLAHVWYYVATVCISLIFNWFMQLSYFIIETHINPEAFHGERTLIDYKTGFIGDFILLPIINCLILYIFLNSKIRLTRIHYLRLAAVGLAADILLHFYQGYLKLTNWSMPRPYGWDFAGYWHMFSFFFQISFVFLFFYMAFVGIRNKELRVARATQSVFLLIGIFLVLFLYDYLPVPALTLKLATEAHHFIHYFGQL